ALQGLPEPLGSVWFVTFSPTDNVLAVGSLSKGIILWDVKDVKNPKKISAAEVKQTVNSLSFSPDGKILASGGAGGSIQLWNASTGESDGPPLNQVTVDSIAFSPDGKLLASACSDDVIRFWSAQDLDARKPLKDLPTGDTGGVTSVAFRSDGKVVA